MNLIPNKILKKKFLKFLALKQFARLWFSDENDLGLFQYHAELPGTHKVIARQTVSGNMQVVCLTVTTLDFDLTSFKAMNN